MKYYSRTSGGRFRHDPAAAGIFIHGGTCLMHGPRDPFAHNADPNRFTITWPIINGGHPFAFASTYPPCRTFSQAVLLAETVRESHPVLHASPIYACTDLIRETPHSGIYQVQLVSHRLAKAQAAGIPSKAAA